MRYLILVMATIPALSNFAVARERSIEHDLAGAAETVSSDQQGSRTSIKIAMGPTSAAQKSDGGMVDSTGSSAKAKPSHKGKRHKHK